MCVKIIYTVCHSAETLAPDGECNLSLLYMIGFVASVYIITLNSVGFHAYRLHAGVQMDVLCCLLRPKNR